MRTRFKNAIISVDGTVILHRRIILLEPAMTELEIFAHNLKKEIKTFKNDKRRTITIRPGALSHRH